MIASLTNSHSTVYCFISNTQLCTSVLLYYCTAVCMQITHLLRIYTSASVKAVRKNKIPVSEHTAVFNQIYQGRGEGGGLGDIWIPLLSSVPANNSQAGLSCLRPSLGVFVLLRPCSYVRVKVSFAFSAFFKIGYIQHQYLPLF